MTRLFQHINTFLEQSRMLDLGKVITMLHTGINQPDAVFEKMEEDSAE